jgi:hypothetical protein
METRIEYLLFVSMLMLILLSINIFILWNRWRLEKENREFFNSEANEIIRFIGEGKFLEAYTKLDVIVDMYPDNETILAQCNLLIGFFDNMSRIYIGEMGKFNIYFIPLLNSLEFIPLVGNKETKHTFYIDKDLFALYKKVHNAHKEIA